MPGPSPIASSGSDSASRSSPSAHNRARNGTRCALDLRGSAHVRSILNRVNLGSCSASYAGPRGPMDMKTADFVDRMALALEADGLPRIAGRIFGLLLISDDCRSLDELATVLHV